MSDRNVPLRRVTCSMAMSMDGYFVDPEGSIDWSAPDEDMVAFFTEQLAHMGVHLLGRRMYESMRYWEDHDGVDGLDMSMRGFAERWRALPKVVFSRTLSTVEGNARLVSRGLAQEIERLRAAEDDGDIAIAGPTLAAEAAALGLIDEYRVRIHPVLLGGGRALFPREGRRVDLDLLETRTFPAANVTYLRFAVRR